MHMYIICLFNFSLNKPNIFKSGLDELFEIKFNELFKLLLLKLLLKINYIKYKNL